MWRSMSPLVMAAAIVASPLDALATDDIVVGQIGPFTVLPVPDATELGQGMKAYFDEANRHGGIRGRRIEFFQLDDAYSTDGFAKQFSVALARRPVALLTPVGSAAIKHMLDQRMLDGADLVVLNALPGAEVLRELGHPKFFHVRAGDRQQIERIVRHLETLGIPSLGVLYQDLPMGHSGLAVAKHAVARAGRIDVSGLKASSDRAAIAEAAKRFAGTEAKSMLVIGTPRFMADAVAELRRAGVMRPVFALSYLSPATLTKSAGPGARGVGITQAFPNPNGATLPLQREFQAAMRKAFPDMVAYTSFQLEGYITAKLFCEAARRAREPSAAEIARALRSQGEFELGGFRVDFSRGNVGSNFVDIGVVNQDGRLMY